MAFRAANGIFTRVAAFSRDNQLPARQKFLADLDRFIQKAAGISSQDQESALSSPLPFEFFAGRFPVRRQCCRQIQRFRRNRSYRGQGKFCFVINVFDHASNN